MPDRSRTEEWAQALASELLPELRTRPYNIAVELLSLYLQMARVEGRVDGNNQAKEIVSGALGGS